MAAFTRAHALGVDGIELDVRLSRDGEVVVIHDADVDRTTDGRGRVSSFTAAELSRMNAGFHFQLNGAYPFRAGGGAEMGVSLLRDVLARFPDELLIIELKGIDTELAARTVAIVREAGSLGRVCFGGFSGITMRAARRADAMVCSSAAREETRWALYRSWALAVGVRLPWPWIRYQAFQVPEVSRMRRVVSPRFIRAAHAADLLVQVWTVNAEADMRRLLEWGVDALISDRPDAALRVRDAFAADRSAAATTTAHSIA
jgi:glycerophosphoryl diester phosphodiesterase